MSYPAREEGLVNMITPFFIKINTIIKSLNFGIDSTLYVDDLMICYRSICIHIKELQLNMNKLNRWTMNNIFTFSKSKPQCEHFYSPRNIHNDPAIKLKQPLLMNINSFGLYLIENCFYPSLEISEIKMQQSTIPRTSGGQLAHPTKIEPSKFLLWKAQMQRLMKHPHNS